MSVDASLLTSSSRAFDVRAFVAVLLKRWPVVIITLVVTVGAAFVYTSRQPRVYSAQASIVIDPVTPNALGKELRDVVDPTTLWWSSHEYLQTQHKIIASYKMALRVVEDAKLHLNERFTGKVAPGEKPPTVEQAAHEVRGMLTVRQVPESRVVNLVVEHTDPGIAALVANTYARVYERYNLDERLGSTTSNTQFLATQHDELRRKLEQAELALYNFRKENGILSVSLKDRQNIISQEVLKLSDAATNAKTRKLELAAKRKQFIALRDQDPLQDATIGSEADKSFAGKLKQEYLNETLKLRDLETKAGPLWPEVKQAKARLEKIHQDLKREADIMVKQVESQYQALVDTEKSLHAALQQVTNDALELNKKELEYNRLLRERDTTARLYDLVISRLKESGIAQEMRSSNVRRLDAALVPTAPIRPNVRNNLALGFAFGLFAGLGFAFLLEYLDRSIKTQEDVEKEVQAAFLGIIPAISSSSHGPDAKKPISPDRPRELYAFDYPKSAVAECCRGIRTNLLFMGADKPIRTMLVASSSPREGKSTTAINLAITIAQSGKRVLLVDTDMRRPRLHRVFGVSGESGLSNLLVGDAKIDDIVRSTEVPNIWLVPCGPTPPNPAELLHSERFKEISRELAERFDQVIFDSPPLAAVTDAAVLSQMVDGVVLVAKSWVTSRDMLARARKQVADVGGRILGCILNDVDLNKRTGGYSGYYYYYYRRYGQYYREADESTAES